MGSFGKFNAGVKSGLKSAKFGDIKDIDVLNCYDCGILRYDGDAGIWTGTPGKAAQRGDFHITGALCMLGDIHVTGTAYLQNTVIKHKTQFSSSGASVFGDDYTDSHQFTGSIFCSQNMSGTFSLSANSLTASYLKITGSTTLGNYTYVWPSASGDANQVLTVDGNGNLEWAAVGDGTDDFTNNGDEHVGNRTFGNITNYTLGILTNNKQRIHLTGEGQGGFVGVGVSGSEVTNMLTLPNIPNVSGSGKAGSWRTYSSRRYKKDIETIQTPIQTVMKLRGVTFKWKNGDVNDMGFIAEEVGAIIPEIVEYESNGIDAESMEYSKVGPLLVEVVKEQQKMIKGLDLAIINLRDDFEYYKLPWWKKLFLWMKKKIKKDIE
tara:strand:+ start:15475 stop:16608 length:1134 start_codon:yes stop_codon:yes gene_type:complete